MVSALQEVDGNILDAKKSLEEFDNELLQLHWSTIDRISDSFSNLGDELSNIADLMDGDVALSDGSWTEEGLTQLGMYAQQYELAKHQAEMYGDEIEQLGKDYLAGKYSATEYTDKLSELNKLQWDSINASESAKDSIIKLNEARVDIIKDGINEEINAYKELTQAKIDELNAEKKLKEYRDKLANQTKKVTDLEKQIEAMSGDTSASTQAKIKQLQEQLAEERKNLSDMQYEHEVETQTEELNQALEDFTALKEGEIESLENYLKESENVVSDSFATVKENASIVAGQLEQIAKTHGVNISDAIVTSWQSGEFAIASYGQTLTAQSSVFTANLIGVQTQVFALQQQANAAGFTISQMFSVTADRLVGELQYSYSNAQNLNNMMQVLRESTFSALNSGYDVSSIVSSLNSVADAADRANTALRNYQNAKDNQPNQSYQSTPQKSSSSSSSSTSTKSTSTPPKKDINSALSTWRKKPSGSSGGLTGGTSMFRPYAKGTKNAKGGMSLVDEEGYELKMRALEQGRYTVLQEGDQVFTHQDTENLWKYSKIDPSKFIEAMRGVSFNPVENAKVDLPNIVQNTSAAPTLHIDNLVNVEGNVDDTNIGRMQAIADSAVNKAFKTLSNEIRVKGGR